MGVRWVLGHFGGGVGLQREGGFYGYPVNRWSIKRPPKGTKLDRRSTGAIPRPLDKPRAILSKENNKDDRSLKHSVRKEEQGRTTSNSTPVGKISKT